MTEPGNLEGPGNLEDANEFDEPGNLEDADQFDELRQRDEPANSAGEHQPWVVRAAQPDDAIGLARLLGGFRCATSDAAWDIEVESQIRSRLLDWAFDPHAVDNDPRVLLVFDRATGGLVGVAAHELAQMSDEHGVAFRGTKVEVVALATQWQGAVFPDGTKASHVLMSALAHDIAQRVPPRHQRSFVVVHEDNERSRRLCHTFGFVQPLSSPHPGYLRLVTE